MQICCCHAYALQEIAESLSVPDIGDKYFVAYVVDGKRTYELIKMIVLESRLFPRDERNFSHAQKAVVLEQLFLA